jgi:hypothetical protein
MSGRMGWRYSRPIRPFSFHPDASFRACILRLH